MGYMTKIVALITLMIALTFTFKSDELHAFYTQFSQQDHVVKRAESRHKRLKHAVESYYCQALTQHADNDACTSLRDRGNELTHAIRHSASPNEKAIFHVERELVIKRIAPLPTPLIELISTPLHANDLPSLHKALIQQRAISTQLIADGFIPPHGEQEQLDADLSWAFSCNQ